MIKLENIHKSYFPGNNELKILRGINIHIKKNEFVAIMGPSGSGKTTLMNIIGCLDLPTSGKYFINGTEIEKLDDDKLSHIRNKQVGFVYQSYNLLNRETAFENVMLPVHYSGRSDHDYKTRAEMLFKKVGLSHRLHHYPVELSGGEQQRVAIARALINDPPIILGDEPTGNLDTKTGFEILELLKKLHKEENKTLLIISHNPEVAETADRIIHLRDGIVVKEALNKEIN